ncbi:hypothetical protein L7F22_049629 [Adiantum nelumboides]|nr:hypothetical protein [Adiantum nelumboides]
MGLAEKCCCVGDVGVGGDIGISRGDGEGGVCGVEARGKGVMGEEGGTGGMLMGEGGMGLAWICSISSSSSCLASLGFWVYYKPLNAAMKRDPYPLPFIDDMLDSVLQVMKDIAFVMNFWATLTGVTGARLEVDSQVESLLQEIKKDGAYGYIVLMKLGDAGDRQTSCCGIWNLNIEYAVQVTEWGAYGVIVESAMFGAWETSDKLWERLCELRLLNVFEYGDYELQFTDLWDKWVTTLAIGKKASDIFKRDHFVAGLCPPLKDKMKTRFPVTFEATRVVARLKERKLRYQLQHQETDQEGDGGARPPPGNVAPPHRGLGVVDQQELLRRITSQLEEVKEGNRKTNTAIIAGKAKVKEEEVSLHKGKGKGKEKQEEVDAMPIKRARQDETADSEADTRRKTKESAESSSKKKTKPRQKLTVKDISLGESSQSYDLVDDVSM